jgi:hypothetical protein
MIESFISADSHVVEPADLWTTRMDRRFRDRAPHFERGAAGDRWVVEGLHSLPIGLFGPMVSEKAQGGIDDRGQERRHEETRPGAYTRRPASPTRGSIMSKRKWFIRGSALRCSGFLMPNISTNVSASTTTGWPNSAAAIPSGCWAARCCRCVGRWSGRLRKPSAVRNSGSAAS